MGQDFLCLSSRATSLVDIPFGGLNIAYPLLSLLPPPETCHLPSDSGHSPLIAAGLLKVEHLSSTDLPTVWL